MATDIDDSFRKQGSVPFKWEIRPGVPKIQPLQHKQMPNSSPQPLLSDHQPQKLKLRPPPAGLEPHARTQSFRSPSAPRIRSEMPNSFPQRLLPDHEPQKPKLRPPPAGLEPHARTRSFRSPSTPRSRSERWRFEQSTRVLPEPGCFPTPFLRRKESKRRVRLESESEGGYCSDFDTLGRWSLSSRRSVSQLSLNASPASSSFSSYKSSPRALTDADWAAFALF